MFHRFQDALGLPGAGKPEMIMDRTDHQIQFSQYPVWQIQTAIFQNIDFDSLE
ncbi:hypothetical protein [Nitrosomonas nitrosa]|uniref:hypothetical protein n=1 Tax=Nitrosomonas nitrosa TaxID=52442 RepID=UPI001EF9DBE4|nr:hypothetical protein [Nitrosomonas nitrosa]